MVSRAAAAGVVRGRAASARLRLSDGAWSIGQCALAAGVGWLVADRLLGHPRPFFACVAAVVCLGVRAQQRLRRVGELAVGVTVGVAVGDALVGVIGVGAWQIALVVGVAMVVALAVDGGPLLVAQSGLQAVFVVALPRLPGSGLARWEDALVGGAMALAVAALLPADPWRTAGRSAKRSFDELAAALRCCALALRDDDPARAAEALSRARATEEGLRDWADALFAGREITRLSPLRRDRGGVADRLGVLQTGVDRATRNVRVLARRIVYALETGEQLPAGLAKKLDRLASAVEAVGGAEDSGPPEELLLLAADLDPEPAGTYGLSTNLVIAQLRSTVVDLLVGVGLPVERARTALPPLG